MANYRLISLALTTVHSAALTGHSLDPSAGPGGLHLLVGVHVLFAILHHIAVQRIVLGSGARTITSQRLQASFGCTVSMTLKALRIISSCSETVSLITFRSPPHFGQTDSVGVMRRVSRGRSAGKFADAPEQHPGSGLSSVRVPWRSVSE